MAYVSLDSDQIKYPEAQVVFPVCRGSIDIENL